MEPSELPIASFRHRPVDTKAWIPACAGMTNQSGIGRSGCCEKSGHGRPCRSFRSRGNRFAGTQDEAAIRDDRTAVAKSQAMEGRSGASDRAAMDSPELRTKQRSGMIAPIKHADR